MSTASYESPVVRYLRYALVLTVIGLTVFPIFWMISSSLRPSDAMFSTAPSLIPETITFEHYQTVLGQDLFVQQFFNSIVVSISTTILSVTLATLAGYGWGKYEFPGSNITSLYVIVTRVIPLVVVVVPLFMVLRQLGLISTYPGLVLAYMVFTLPLTSWMLIGFFENIPDNVLNAARIDGMNELQVFRQVALPLVKPGIIATALFCFVMSWQEFLFANTFMLSQEKRTIPVAMFGMMNRYTVEWGPLMAISVVFILPVFLLFIAFQKHFIRGISGAE